MSFEGIPNFKPKEQEKKKLSIRERITFPHVEPILALLKKEFEESEAIDEKVVKDILWEFIEQRIERAGVYNSEVHKAAFPWGVTDIAELAKKLYARYAGEDTLKALQPNLVKKKKEFVFTSLQLIQSGNQFAFMEEPMHQAFKDLPRALSMIREGKEPDSREIYSLGSPTNELGTMSKEFLEKIKDGKAFNEFGALYAEFIKSVIPEEQRRDTAILLYGQSMGASFAAQTAKQMIENGDGTQSSEVTKENNVPAIQVRLDMPVGSSELSNERKKWQIPVGFALDGIYTAVTDSYLRPVMLSDKKFLTSTQEILAERGMPSQSSAEQVALKKEGIKETINSLRQGTPIPENLKVTKVVGLYDPLMYSGAPEKEMRKHKKEHEGSLGASMVSKSKNQKTFGIDMHHTMPYFRENELKRLREAAKSLETLRS